MDGWVVAEIGAVQTGVVVLASLVGSPIFCLNLVH